MLKTIIAIIFAFHCTESHGTSVKKFRSPKKLGEQPPKVYHSNPTDLTSEEDDSDDETAGVVYPSYDEGNSSELDDSDDEEPAIKTRLLERRKNLNKGTFSGLRKL